MGIFSFFKKNKKQVLSDEYDDSFIKPIDKGEENLEKTSSIYDFDLQDEKQYKTVEKSNFKRVSLTEEELDALIIEQILMVISNHNNLEDIEKISAKAASNIGKEYIEVLSTYMKGKISRPVSMKDRYDGLGQWSTAVENAVLAILYSFKQYGVDELLKLTISYKDTKFKAINLLCKLANESIERDKIIDSIIFIMRDVKEDEVLKILRYISQIRNNGKVERLIKLYYKKYILENKIQEAYEITLDLLNSRGRLIDEELVFIKSIALVEGKIDRELIVDGGDGSLDLSNISEEIRIEASIAFHSIKEDDKEINNRLRYLRDNSLNMELRKYLTEVLNKNF